MKCTFLETRSVETTDYETHCKLKPDARNRHVLSSSLSSCILIIMLQNDWKSEWQLCWGFCNDLLENPWWICSLHCFSPFSPALLVKRKVASEKRNLTMEAGCALSSHLYALSANCCHPYLLSLIGWEGLLQILQVQDFENLAVVHVHPHGAFQFILSRWQTTVIYWHFHSKRQFRLSHPPRDLLQLTWTSWRTWVDETAEECSSSSGKVPAALPAAGGCLP